MKEINLNGYLRICFINLILFISFFGADSYAQDLKVDFDSIVKKDIKKGPGSANLCWLTDSDLNNPNPVNSMIDAIKKLGAGSLRFPYGHLSDNYLWHSPPYNDLSHGLRPRVASMKNDPADWDWAVDEDGYFKNDMDFDEYMQMCQTLNIKPLVVVNVFSFKYEGGPSKEELLNSAVEWVKYAKKKNYKMAYWQIGNEVDHHKKLLKPQQYIDLYKTLSEKMKAVDNTIKVGPGILSDTAYFNQIVQKYPDLIDFTSAHQYAWPYIKSCSNYEKWKNHKSDYIPSVKKMQSALNHSVKPNMDIVITETGLSPTGKGMGDINNAYKALWYFEMLMNEISMPNVAYSYFWGTHSPWYGTKDDDNNDLEVLFRVDDNSQKPIAKIIEFVNDNILSNIVEATHLKDYIRLYATRSNDGKKVNLFLMNRNDKPQNVTVKMEGLPKSKVELKEIVLSGVTPLSRKINIESSGVKNVDDKQLSITLAPLSITLLEN